MVLGVGCPLRNLDEAWAKPSYIPEDPAAEGGRWADKSTLPFCNSHIIPIQSEWSRNYFKNYIETRYLRNYIGSSIETIQELCRDSRVLQELYVTYAALRPRAAGRPGHGPGARRLGPGARSGGQEPAT